MERLAYLMLRVTPVALLVGAVMSFATVLFSLTLSDEMAAGEVAVLVVEGLLETAVALAAAAFAYWFRRLVEKEFPEVRN